MDDRLTKGKMLKQAREAKGISLISVHEATKIPMDSLKAIEEGYKVRTLTDFYYRSFTKLYARYLGVDLSLLVDQSSEKKMQKSKEEIKEELVSTRSLLDSITPDLKLKMMKGAVGLVFIFILFRIGGCLLKQSSDKSDLRIKQQPSAMTRSQESISSVEQEDLRDQPQAQAPLPAQTSQMPMASQRDNTQRVNIVVRAKKRTWIQVSVDHQVVFRSTLDKGVVESWSALEEIELAIKNITDLDVEYNGRILDSLGSRSRSPRKILFTSSGFKIED